MLIKSIVGVNNLIHGNHENGILIRKKTNRQFSRGLTPNHVRLSSSGTKKMQQNPVMKSSYPYKSSFSPYTIHFFWYGIYIYGIWYMIYIYIYGIYMIYIWYNMFIFSMEKQHLWWTNAIAKPRSGTAWSSCFGSVRAFDAKLTAQEDVYDATARGNHGEIYGLLWLIYG